MTAPFAALEARVNAAVVKHLANATADFGGGVVVDVEFMSPSADALGLVAGNAPVARGRTSELSMATTGTPVSINGVAYAVSSAEADGMGMTLLRLVLQEA